MRAKKTTIERLYPHLTEQWQSIPDLAWKSDMRSEQATKGLRSLFEQKVAERRHRVVGQGTRKRRMLEYRLANAIPDMQFYTSGINVADAAMKFHQILARAA